jgi:hypothetical protein
MSNDKQRNALFWQVWKELKWLSVRQAPDENRDWFCLFCRQHSFSASQIEHTSNCAVDAYAREAHRLGIKDTP